MSRTLSLYRPGVGALLLAPTGLVFVGRRIDTPGDAWQLPQGGVDEGEDPDRAVLRELAEEVGTDKAVFLARCRAPYRYDLPEALAASVWGGRYRGQSQIWYALRFTGTDSDINLNATDHPEFDAWRWVPIDDLPGLAVAFKRSLYESLVAEFRPLCVPLAATPAPAPAAAAPEAGRA